MLQDGALAGWRAADNLGKAKGAAPQVPTDRQACGITHPFRCSHPKGREFVDFDEDLQIKDIKNAVKDGYDDIQLVKRYSTLGMGPSQGRNSNIAGIRLVADATGKSADEVGTTTARPPFAPEKFAHLAGRSFEPVRLTAMHHRHVEAGARMMTAGLWLRPAFYGPKDEAERLIADEVRNCRENVGLIDVSTLGGLDIRGPDAAEFINRVYTWAYLKQQVGRARYLLMCDETGVIVDDGVACRFHEQHYYVTATTSGVDAVYRQMLWWNAQWKLDVDIANVTAAYAGVNIAGPNSREVVETLDSDIDFPEEAFPYMGVRQGHIAGIPVRVSAGRFRRRARLRDPLPILDGRGALGPSRRGWRTLRPEAVRRRGAAGDAPRERPYHHRPGHRWSDPALRGGHGLGDCQEKGVLCRQARGRDPECAWRGQKAGGLHPSS